MKFNGDHTYKRGENTFGLTQSLAAWKTPQYRYLGCFGHDVMYGEGIHNDQDGALCEDILKNKSYIIAPQMSEWHKIYGRQ
eukprot:4671450-Ditylum_brightwellii.AAC.1